ncbi:MAG: TatD family hydrolase [Treponema sp.]|jgi:TatD DNase family protein|nr:TatD family hydrolase [Treponema sp.]
MKLIDIGINLMNSAYDRDRSLVVQAAAVAGVSPLVITGSSERSSLDAAIFASAFGADDSGVLYSTAGVHPHEAKNCGNDTIDFLRELVKEKSAPRSGIKAIGECGLDYNRNFSPQDAQRRWFIKQIELAAELSLPLFLHERDAFADFSIILSGYIKTVPAAVVHCFTGNGDELDYYLSLGCYIGITGWICDERRGKHLRELIKNIPSDRLLLETDAPYLLPRDLPEKVRNKRNEPRFLPHIAQTAAQCLGKEPDVLAEETTANAKRFFGI